MVPQRSAGFSRAWLGRQESEAKLATTPSPDPAPPPSDPGKEKLEELAAWLRDGLELLVGLGDEGGGSSNKRGAAIVEFCARHGVSLEPDSRGKYLLSSLLAWSVELHD